MAWQDLWEAQNLATYAGMKLYEADCIIEASRLFLAQGERKKAQEHLTIARDLIQIIGYHRRDIDLEDLEKKLRQ